MVQLLDTNAFKEKVFNYDNASEFKYVGNKPAIIDFYADWCGPCKMLAPILEELSNEYGDKLRIYKVNTEIETELSSIFGIRSIPTMLFCPLNEDPQMANGALPKEELIRIIEEVLKVKKD